MQASSDIVPVSASDISRTSYEHKYLIEEKIVSSLVETINQGIRDQVSHGLLQYEFTVPSLLYGFPRFDDTYVSTRLRDMYGDKGFQVTGIGKRTLLTWKDGRLDEKPTLPAKKPTVKPRSSSSATKKIPLLLLKST